jgi:hypothetical protein
MPDVGTVEKMIAASKIAAARTPASLIVLPSDINCSSLRHPIASSTTSPLEQQPHSDRA